MSYQRNNGGGNRGYGNHRGGGGNRRFGGNKGGNRRFGGGGGGRRRGGGRFHPYAARPASEEELFGTKLSTGINFDNFDKIPVSKVGSNAPEGIDSFDKSGLHPRLLENVTKCGYTKPTPIQKHAIPTLFADRDVMACAQTGSGKTAAFLLPVISKCLSAKSHDSNKSHQQNEYRYTCRPFAVVLSPTRELSKQIHIEAQKLMWKTDLRTVCVYGGASQGGQLSQLEYGCDVLVATAGRLNDFIERERISLDSAKYLIMDEADTLLDMGFMPQIRQIVSTMPKKEDRGTLMFSATFPRSIQELAKEFLNNHIHLTIGKLGSAVDSIAQIVKYASYATKFTELTAFLNDEEKSKGRKIIFVARKRDADYIERQLSQSGYYCVCIHGDKSQNDRERSLRMFKKGECDVLIGTDVASRGLDVPNVNWVVNYDLPDDIDTYVHRIGRTGRAGNKGNALSFVSEADKGILRNLHEKLGENKENEIPDWFQQLVAKYGKFGGKRRWGNKRNSYGRNFGGGGGRRSWGNKGGQRKRNSHW